LANIVDKPQDSLLLETAWSDTLCILMRGRACTILVPCLCLLLASCATIGPPLPPSLELPKPPSDLRAIRKADTVVLSWTVPTVTSDRLASRHPGATRICRGLEPVLTKCGTPVGETAPAPPLSAPKSSGKKSETKILAIQTTHTDILPKQLEKDNPLGFVTYAVEALNRNGRSAGLSNQVQVPLAETLPPPHDFSAEVTGKGVVLTGTGGPVATHPMVRYVYRIYRRPEGSPQQILVGQVPDTGEGTFTFTDPSIEWEKTYEYRANVATVVARPGQPDAQVEGEDTPDVKVFTHDIYPPAVPSGLQAVFSGPGQPPFIDLIWAPVTDLDFTGYNVYRHEPGSPPEKMNTEPLKTPTYRDSAVFPGKTYSYSVSSVDLRGNESARSEEASERVP
jgi:hypothetical protein